MLVRDVMSKDILKVNPGDNALKVGSLMDAKLIGAAVVVVDDEFRGIISKETFVVNIGKLFDRTLESLCVSDLMESDIDQVKTEDDVNKAVDLLITQKSIIDRLPVIQDGKVVGLISKADLTGLFSNRMRGKYKVADLMHYEPLTVCDYTPLDRVVKEMQNMAVKRVLVLEGERLVGIISVRDLSIALFREKKLCRKPEPRSTLTAGDIMTPNPITIKRKADATEAAKIMVEKGIGGLPVVNGKLDGIISRGDILKGYQLASSQKKSI